MKKIIEDIENSSLLSGEEKLQALCEIDLILRGKTNVHCLNSSASNLLTAFPWYLTPSGYFFWNNIYRLLLNEPLVQSNNEREWNH